MHHKKLPLVVSGGMALLSGALLAYSIAYSPRMMQALDAGRGLMFFPRIVLTFWFATAIILFWQYWRTASFTMKPVNLRTLGYSVGMIFLMCVMLTFLGFVPACAIFSFLYPFLLGYKNIRVLAVVSVLYAVTLWYIFSKLLLIILPQTPWL